VLNTNIEFRKGILFIRLDGILDKYTVNNLDDIYKFINENNIKKIVFNLNEIKKIDEVGNNNLYNLYKKFIKNKVSSMFVDNDFITYKVNKIPNELKAMEVIWN